MPVQHVADAGREGLALAAAALELPVVSSAAASACLPVAAAFCMQRRREAYKRYLQLKRQGKLKGGANIPLASGDSFPGDPA